MVLSPWYVISWGCDIFNIMVIHHYPWSDFLFFILKLCSMYLFLWQFPVLLITTDFHYIINSDSKISLFFYFLLRIMLAIPDLFNLNFKELTKHSLFLFCEDLHYFCGDCFDSVVSFETPKVFLIVYAGLSGYNPLIWKTSGTRILFIKALYSYLFSFPIIIFKPQNLWKKDTIL